jgi:hypothetical protein
VPAQLNETLVFELLSPNGAWSLCERLRPRWHVMSVEADEVALVAAELRPAPEDLGILLRAVQLWAGDNEVTALRFHLDGRPYVLDAPPARNRRAAA